ncbi:putative DNA-binding ribbon-helix-helix protein [Azospirillum fermentarium]|uniref:ribbon-helix-helix domain-containing protein n=1 Tax=Azospirillum fermentarium TaxID=1233114 RepID=UPI00222751B4|nr:ribbon-helix-helix domain-containing protein [Azospirillum fermentarium]MCW2248900.1 putative DNA-binding ribbon-helix-helix protein [Azospirillum fermentarium]
MPIQQRIKPATDVPPDSPQPESAVIIPWPMVISRTVRCGSRRLRVTLETAVWEGLADIARRERMTVEELCAEVDGRRGSASLAGALRVLVLHYFKAADGK